MGFISALERRASPENPSTSLSNPAPWLFEALGETKTSSGVSVSERSAMRFSAVFACVRILAETVGVLPLPVYERVDGGRDRAMEHPNWRLLHDRPNPELSSFNWRELLQAHLALWGNAWCEKEFNAAGRVVALWPLMPNKTRADRINGVKVIRTFKPDGNEIVLPAANVLHIPGLGFNGLQGFSPIRMAMKAIGLGMAAEEFGSSFYGRGATLGGVLKHPNRLSEPAHQNLRQSFEALHGGLSNAHRVAILEEGMSYESIGIPPDEAQFLQLRKFQLNEIARIYRIPPHMIADLDRPFQSNVEQMGLDFVRHTMTPWLTRWEQVLNWELFSDTERERFFAEFLVEGLLRGDTAARSQFYREQWGIGALSINEIRQRENLNPVEGGDERFVPLNMVPLSASSVLVAGNGEQDDPEPQDSEPADRGMGQTERRSLAFRVRLADAHRPLLLDAAGRIMRRETQAGLAAVKRAREASDFASSFRQWMEEFYPSQTDYVTQQLQPVFTAMGEALWTAAVSELADQEGIPPEAVEFFEAYTRATAAKHVGQSRGQLEGVINGADTETVADAVETRLNEWQELRPTKIAANETTKFRSAVSRAAWLAVGVTLLEWAANADACPLCMEMDGRIVDIERPFIRPGDTVDPEDEETAPLTSRATVAHPPLHQGCECNILARL